MGANQTQIKMAGGQHKGNELMGQERRGTKKSLQHPDKERIQMNAPIRRQLHSLKLSLVVFVFLLEYQHCFSVVPPTLVIQTHQNTMYILLHYHYRHCLSIILQYNFIYEIIHHSK